jgi:hypothetical protein
LNSEPPAAQSEGSPIQRLLAALESRHLANLTRAEAARALRALSSCYVERRAKLVSGAPLETAGKRAAFALYYGPLHFAIASEIVHASTFHAIRTIHDFGCGTGVGSAAWALQMAGAPRIAAIDRSAWAVDEANWLYRQVNVRGRASRGDLSRALTRGKGFRAGDALLFAYSLNEIPETTRSTALSAVIHSVERGASLLVIEPVGRRLGNEGWWSDWKRALEPLGADENEWRFPATLLPQRTRDLARAAGLDPKELTARTLAAR